MRTAIPLLGALLSLPVLAQAPAAAPASVDQVLDSFARVVTYRQVAISPDGSRVAWVQSVQEKDGPAADKSSLFVAEVASPGKPPVRVTAAAGADRDERDLAWSPDGRQLAFLSDAEKAHQLQLYVTDFGGGKPRQLTHLDGTVSSPRWSPDGKRLAVLYIAQEADTHGALGAAPRDMGVVEETIHESRITVVDLAGGSARELSPPDLFVYEYDWSPDGSTFAAIAAPGSGVANWWLASLYAVSASSGETRRLLEPKMQIANPRWSPDGKEVAFIGGLMSDEGLNGGDVFVLPATGGEPRDVTPGMKGSASWLTWTSADQLLFGEYVDGESGLATVGRRGGRITSLWMGPESISRGSTVGVSLARDGRTSAVVRQSFTRPPEVYAGPIGAWARLTHGNDGVLASWGEGKKLHWRSDGAQVDGWLVAPPKVEPGRRYPMVVWVHGGPALAYRPAFNERYGVLASQGFYVFLPNPRGSFGQGEAFTRGNVKDFGYGDLRDILRGVDEVVRSEPVDGARVGIAGWSYGGYMSMWAVTQTRRFRAAMAGAGISNWQSYYGQNRIETWLLPYFGASVYDAPQLYARSSPINFIKQVRTPTLVLQGERDSEVPAPQAYEFWRALKRLGVDTQLVVYADEGHNPRQPANRRDLIRRTAEWFGRYLAPAPSGGTVQAPK